MQEKNNSIKEKMQFTLPGIYHEIKVCIVSRRYAKEKYKKLEGKAVSRNEELLGFYNHSINSIYIVKELAPERRFHTLMHELVHMIEAETEELNEEAKCDLVGAYLLRLFTDQDFIKKINDNVKDKKLK